MGTGWTSLDEARARVREVDAEARKLAERAQLAADRIIQLETALSRRDADIAELQHQLAQTRQERDAANRAARRLLEEVERLQREGRGPV